MMGYFPKKSIVKHLSGFIKRAGVIVLCLNLHVVFCQNQKLLPLSIKPVFGKDALVLDDSTYSLANGNTVQFETLKFYMSNVQLFKNEVLVWESTNGFYLIDASDIKTTTIQLTIPDKLVYNNLKFNLGIDSITNTSGAMEGDLDPTKGMYWTWQSGYINFKLEGKSNLCQSPKKEFQFHLGGYQYPFNALKKVSLTVAKKKKMTILFDVEQFIKNTDLSKKDHIMSPTAEAIKLSELATTCFSVQ